MCHLWVALLNDFAMHCASTLPPWREHKTNNDRKTALCAAETSHIDICLQHLRRTRHNGQAVSSRVRTRIKLPPDLLITLIGVWSPATDCHASNMPACQLCRSFGSFRDIGPHTAATSARDPMVKNGELPPPNQLHHLIDLVFLLGPRQGLV
jgi:hypothetical protein